MPAQPSLLALEGIGEVLAEHFRGRDTITCYLGSNAATPTASIEALTKAVALGKNTLPFIRMVHLLLQGPVPYLAEGLQDRIMAYSLFSTEEVRKA
ncbi:MAG TPA: hypothetical protein PKL83_06225, partial [bacterium]|nr:hypothetical protein [bacterium]